MRRAPALELRGRRSLRHALWLLVLLATVLTLALGVLLAQPPGNPVALLLCYAAIGWANVVVGALAWGQRPANRTGLLLVVAGLLTLLSAAGNVADPVLGTIGTLLGEAPIGAVLHQVIAFPSGRLSTRRDVGLVVAGYLGTVGLQVPQVLASPGPPISLGSSPGLVHVADVLQSIGGAVVLGIAAVVLLRRYLSRRSTVAERRSLAVVYGYGIGLILSFPLTADLLRNVFDWSDLTLVAVQLAAVAGLPFVLAFAILRGGFARTTEIEELGAWLGAADPTRLDLRNAIADALGDPSVDLLFVTADDRGGTHLVDARGRAASTPDPRTGRAAVEVLGPHGPIARIVYDTRLTEDSYPVAQAGRLVALAIERERLTAELLASRAAVRESRARILEGGDEQRRQVARDLHDLVQSRLVLAALHAGTLATGTADAEATKLAATRLRLELTAAVVELRDLVHGVMPALLLERGVFAAAEDLADRQPMPVDLVVDDDHGLVPALVASTCYFVLAEALSNIVKHSGATRVRVQLARRDEHLRLDVQDDGVGTPLDPGNGLRGMRDRVEALAGRLEVGSSPGDGTWIRVELPCAS